jgi:hypothetical protein
MATARDVITRALRKRKVSDPTAAELVDGLEDLNDMLAAWAIDGIDIQHVTLASGDTVDVPDNHILTLALSLAERLTEYGSPLEPEDIMAAERGRTALRALYFSIGDLTSDNPLSRCNASTEE